MKRFFSICAVGLLSGFAAHAQFDAVLDNAQTQSVETVWSTNVAIIVGSTTSNNFLYIGSGGEVVSTGGTVGQGAGASNNLAWVEGSGASWTINGALQLGSGVSNIAGVSDGGFLAVDDLYIAEGNNFYLNNGGTFRIDNNWNVQDRSTNGFNWNSGGTLALTGNLTGMAVSNNAVFLNNSRGLVLDGGTLETGTNDLTIGMGSTGNLTVSNGGWVIVGEATTNDIVGDASGGILVASTNTAELVADNGSFVDTSGTLYIGSTNAGQLGVVTVTNGSTIKVADLLIESGSAFNLDSGGTLFASGNYNADTQAGVNWSHGGTLAVGGELTKAGGLDETDGDNLILTIAGGGWNPGGDLRLAGISNRLNIVNGGAVTNSDAYVVGTGNVVVVENTGSHWVNNGALNITNSGNGVWVRNGGRIEADTLNIAINNSLNLNDGGTFHVTGDFDVANQSNLNWNSGGNLSVGGNLEGMALTNGAAYLNGGRKLTLDGGMWNTGTSNLTVGLGSSGKLYTDNGGWVIVGEATTNDIATDSTGGILVASTNNAELLADNSSWVETIGKLYIGGVDTNLTGSVTVRDGSTVKVADLVINETSEFNINDTGNLHVTGDYDYTLQSNVNWNSGGELIVGGKLTGMLSTNLVVGGATNVYKFLDGERDLTLDEGIWDITGTNLVVGLNSDNSQLLLRNGALLNSATTYIGFGSNAANNEITVSGGATWSNSGDLWIGSGGSGGNYLIIADGGTNNVAGSVHIGSTNTSGNYAAIYGSDSFWNISTDLNLDNRDLGSLSELQVFDNGSVVVGGDLNLSTSNRIYLASGGAIAVEGSVTASSNTAFLGTGNINFGLADNDLLFAGSNIVVDSGIVFDGGAGSDTVKVMDGLFYVSPSISNQYVNFEAMEFSNSTLSGTGMLHAATFGSVQMTGGTISPGTEASSIGTLEIGGDFSVSGTRYLAQVLGTDHDELIVHDAGGLDLSGLDLTVFVPVSAVNTNFNILTAVNGFGGSEFASTNVSDRMLLFDAQLEYDPDGNNVTVKAVANNTKFSSALTYAGSEGIRSGFGGMKNAVFARTKQLRRNLVATDHAISHEAYLLGSTNGPSGVMGPGDENTIFDMHFWMQQFSGQGTYDGEGNSYGFDLNNNGTSFGLDKLLGEALAVGLNYTYARSDAQTTNRDKLDTETYWLGAYGEWVNEDGFYVDALAAYGRSDYDSIRREENYEGAANYSGYAIGGYVDVGQYYHYKNLALSPYIGLHALTVMTEDHEETDTAGSVVSVDKDVRNWVESAMGLKLRHRFDTTIGRFQTTGFAEWSHDFIQEDIYATLSANGLPAVDMADISPDPDTINVGAGLSWISTDYLEIGVGYNGRYSDRYEEHTGSLMLDVRF